MTWKIIIICISHGYLLSRDLRPELRFVPSMLSNWWLKSYLFLSQGNFQWTFQYFVTLSHYFWHLRSVHHSRKPDAQWWSVKSTEFHALNCEMFPLLDKLEYAVIEDFQMDQCQLFLNVSLNSFVKDHLWSPEVAMSGTKHHFMLQFTTFHNVWNSHDTNKR